MVIHLRRGDCICYAFNNPEINRDNVDQIIASNEVVLVDDKVVSGHKRALMLTIAALDTLLKKYNRGKMTNFANLYYFGRHEVKKFLAYYLFQEEHIWEVAIHLGTSSEEEVMRWLTDLTLDCSPL